MSAAGRRPDRPASPIATIGLVRRHALCGLTLALASGVVAAQPDDFDAARVRMLEAVDSDFREVARQVGRSHLDPRVRAALARVPRHRFVPESLRHRAYLNRPLPIGLDQTISQPFIVALMSDLAEIGPGDRVLEIGTGSAYQAAILAELARRVYTIEIIPALGRQAGALLRNLGYRNVETRIGDGYLGWPDAAPFDAILVTAAPEKIPEPLIEQLAPGGRLVAPVGPQGGHQDLRVLRKLADGRIESRNVVGVRFVPLTRTP